MLGSTSVKRYLFVSIAVCVALGFSGCNLLSMFRPASQAQPAMEGRDLSALPAAEGHKDEVLFIVANADQRSFVTGSKDGTVLLWNEKPPKAKLLFDNHGPIDDAAFDASTQRLATLVRGVIRIFDLSTGQPVALLDRLSSRILDMQFSTDGNALIFGASDNRAYRWRFVDELKAKTISDRQKAFERYNGPSLPVSKIAVHPDGRLFFTGDWDGSVSGWLTYTSDRQGGYYDKNVFGPQFFSEGATRIKFDRSNSQDPVQQLEISKDGKLIVCAVDTGLIEIWKIRGSKKAVELKPHEGDIFALAISPDSKLIATAGRDGFVRFLKVHENTEEEQKAKTDRTFDYELTEQRAIALPDVRSVTFRDNNAIIAGDRKGNIFEIYAVE